MPSAIYLEETVKIGEPVVYESKAPEGSFSVVFEDDGETGYFYALDNSDPNFRIQDSVHIYNVESVTDADIPSVIQIAWTLDGSLSALIINRYHHAVFDFKQQQGYSRTGFPGSNGRWSTLSDHKWSDSVLNQFK